MKLLSILLCLFFIQVRADVESHLRKIENRVGTTIKNVDSIYVINLDQRPEKYAHALTQLSPYGIIPIRFPAIYGWRLTPSDYYDLALKFGPGMWNGKDHVCIFPQDERGVYQFIGLNEEHYGKGVFSGWMTPGGLGCTLSHLSILKDAYDAGCETIWIMEDDVVIRGNPHRLSDYIAQLDELAGRENWDVLYTDCDYLTGLDESRDLLDQVPMKWRPDMPSFDLRPFLEHTEVGENFVKIGSRIRTHSMVVRRSGMEKILNFYKTHDIFLPYDHEIAFIPGLKFYNSKDGVASCTDGVSDTKDWHF